MNSYKNTIKEPVKELIIENKKLYFSIPTDIYNIFLKEAKKHNLNKKKYFLYLIESSRDKLFQTKIRRDLENKKRVMDKILKTKKAHKRQNKATLATMNNINQIAKNINFKYKEGADQSEKCEINLKELFKEIEKIREIFERLQRTNRNIYECLNINIHK